MNSRAQGFALILAIFMIVTLAGVGAYLVTVSTGQAQAVTQDVNATRAYRAARAGLEWGAYQRLQNSSCAGTTLVFTNPGLAGFRAIVTCARVTPVAGESEGGATVHVYLVTATGCNANPCTPANPPANYVERVLQLTISQ